jgi:N-acetylglutamate synthase-like GNAT family acetyltransferase
MAAVLWNPAEKEAFLRSQFEFQTAHYRRHYHDAEFLIVEKDSVPIGRVYLHRGEAGLELMDIALLPEWRGSGAGTAFLGQILHEARAAGQPVILYVEMFNRAQNLYARLGFRVIGEEGVYLKMEWRPDPLSALPAPASGDQADEATAGQQQR